ncbi:MAG: MarR family transcriptional regulator [Pirellulales bacterium]
MNQIARSRRRPASPGNGRHDSPSVSLGDASVHAQARELDAIFKALARKVWLDDDPADELPLRQFRVCIALFEGPRSMSQLSRGLGVSQSAITQIADRLQTAGMVTRLPGGGDRRVRRVQLTTRARKMLRLREEKRIERVMQILKGMTAAARNNVLASMAAFGEAAGDP